MRYNIIDIEKKEGEAEVQAQQQYKTTVNRIAFSLLLFLAASALQGGVLAIFPYVSASLSDLAADVIYELLSGVLYAAVFCLPVLFFSLITPKAQREPMYLDLKMPRESLLYILFGVAVFSAAAYAKSFMVSIFDYSDFSEEVLWNTDVSSNYQLVLMFLTLAIIPAFVEELLFRGMVLGNLLPYGRTTAIFASALLFGLMHQNIEQMFYATVAGIVLGWVYASTRSIWPCVLLHLFNNFQSVLQTAVLERLPEGTASAILYIVKGVLFLAGILSGVLLFLREKDRRPLIRRMGAFGRELEPSEEYAVHDLPLSVRVKGFFTPPMIAFCVLCVLSMLALVLMAVLLY